MFFLRMNSSTACSIVWVTSSIAPSMLWMVVSANFKEGV